ncbi:hypothetical protein CEXT_326951 [Caerostris extrusa]|uniref:FMN-dependent dehydrogenase domain-containing protein n=1 Tax=Caerostris extrusa TaxID=172846 RepID=A0AAV4VVH1_CAEEX|nr:hypothetical protein CEXT_326951 [Caerostris extrusa]
MCSSDSGYIERLNEMLESVNRIMLTAIQLTAVVGIAVNIDSVCAGLSSMGYLRTSEGQDGVSSALEILRKELDKAMHLAGCNSIRDIGPHLVQKETTCQNLKKFIQKYYSNWTCGSCMMVSSPFYSVMSNRLHIHIQVDGLEASGPLLCLIFRLQSFRIVTSEACVSADDLIAQIFVITTGMNRTIYSSAY